MRKFQFRLQTLLKLREIQEKQAKVALAEATNRLLGEKKTLREFEDQLTKSFDLFRLEQKQKSTVDMLKMFHNYFDKMKEDIHKQQMAVTNAEQCRLECLQLLEKAMKSRQLVEKFHEKRLDEYNAEVLREEQKLLDEIGIQIYSSQK
jgi:flagellar FliJ protein